MARKPPKPKKNIARPPAKTRRELMAGMQTWGLAALAIGGIGYWVVSDVGASMSEHDLSKIGNGTPAVVQVHDPNCPVCASLMNETREALKSFDTGELQYLIANIKQTDGQALAQKYGVPHLTLLLFDGAGQMRTVLSGPNKSAQLISAFRRHLQDSRAAASG